MQLIIVLAVIVVAIAAIPVTSPTTPVPSHTMEENGPLTLGPEVEQSLSKLPKEQQEAARNLLNALAQMAQKLKEVAQEIQKDPEAFKAAVMKNLQVPQGAANQGMMKPPQ